MIGKNDDPTPQFAFAGIMTGSKCVLDQTQLDSNAAVEVKGRLLLSIATR
jgi:hypothetical protein